MGEDFIEKRHRQFTRCTDAAFEQLSEPDLFSDVPASTSAEVVGFAIDGIELSVGQDLWQMPQGNPDTQVFCHGKHQAVELVGEAAAVAGQLGTESGVPVTGTVVSISPDGLVTLRFHKPYKN